MLVTDRCWFNYTGANLAEGFNTGNMQKKKYKNAQHTVIYLAEIINIQMTHS